MKLLLTLMFVVTATIGLADEAVRITDAWARASILVSRPGAAYVTLTSDRDDRLVAVETPVAETVMIHRSEVVDAVSRMAPLTELPLPAGEQVTLAPGGTHLMLMGLKQKLVEGASFPMVLRFASGAEIAITVPVLGIAAIGPESGQ